ncbi:hypothetical protein D3C71_2215120 [compost metagenome]
MAFVSGSGKRGKKSANFYFQQSAAPRPVAALSMPLTPWLFKVSVPHLSALMLPVRVALRV